MSETWADGRIAVVTGATSGFGEAMTRRLIAAGGRVEGASVSPYRSAANSRSATT